VKLEGDQEVVNCVTKRGVGSAARRGIRRGLHHRFPNLPPTRRKRQIHKLRGEPLRRNDSIVERDDSTFYIYPARGISAVYPGAT